MTNKHKILRNRVFYFSFKDKISQSTFDLVSDLNTDVLEIVKNNLLKRPTTTINFLRTIEPDLKWCQDFLLNEVSIPVQNKIIRKDQITELEGHNFEQGGQLSWQIEEIIDIINTSIESVKPQRRKEPGEKRVKLNPEIEINDNWKKYVSKGGKLSQPEIALLCVYEGIVIPKPSGKNENVIANNLAIWHGHTSGSALYNTYDELSDKNNRLTNRKPKTMIKYFEHIMPLISPNNLPDIKKDLKEIDL